MKRLSECTRRLHLDFHNPPGVPDLCADFDPAEFAETIARAGFDSATVFAQDSQGHGYFPTEVGVRHPQLTRDLLGEMVEALHAREITAGAYIAVGCSSYSQPEWAQVDAQGHPRRFVDQGGFSQVCVNSPYVETNILPLTAEVLRRYPVDCVWYDMLFFFDEGCRCQYCLERMKRHGLDPDDPLEMRRHMRDTIDEFVVKTRRLADTIRPDVEMTYNGLSIHERPRGIQQAAYVDVEALATGGWGYFYFPSKARYLRTLGKPVAGMTAAFHESWGDFGSLKSRAQLEYECYTFLAAGSAVGIGDQLPPRGRLEPARYARIGEVLNPIAALDPWLRDARPLAEAAVLLYPLAQGQFPGESWAGACKVLLEAKIQFDTVDIDADWSRYPLLILPDQAYTDDTVRQKIAAYLAGGGAVLATGEALAVLPADIVAPVGEASTEPTYLRVRGAWAGEIPDIPHVVKCGIRPISAPGAEVLATVVAPYPRADKSFFYSSPQLPYSRETEQPAIIKSGRLLYIAAPLFSEYWRRGYGVHRQLLIGALHQLLPAPLTRSELPLPWEHAVLAQGKRLVNIIVPYSPARGESAPQIEDWPAVAGLTAGVRGKYDSAYLAPGREPITIHREGSYTIAELPPVQGPVVVVFE
ncbi:MAG: alpha-amylase family protein [Armatimonadota bacterium]